MKTRFNTYDIICGVAELQQYVGLRVNQIYDIDNKTYLIRLQEYERKVTLLIESGIRFHTTNFEWPKNLTPSGFSMKLRKHLKNKRLESVKQLGIDRIVKFQFGMDDAAYHVIVELYDRGNILLADCDYTILYILRPHYEGENVHFAVREKYPENRAKQKSEIPNEATMRELLAKSEENCGLRHFLMTILDYGPSIIDHVLKKHKLSDVVVKLTTTSKEAAEENPPPVQSKKSRNKKSVAISKNVRIFDEDKDMSALMLAIKEAEDIFNEGTKGSTKGYIIQKREEKPAPAGKEVEYFFHNIEYHPFLFEQWKDEPHVEYDSFMLACDEFYSSLEAQKIDMKTVQLERDALKKLTNVKMDHEKRLGDLEKNQELDKIKADLITNNQELVDQAIQSIRLVIANQMSWTDIHDLVKSAQARGDPIARSIQQLKLDKNLISLKLADPFQNEESEDESDEDGDDDKSKEEGQKKAAKPKMMVVDVDINYTAWANARKYYDKKRTAAQKQQKTIDASGKALKNAEKITQQTLKDVRTISNIAKARKVYWFEKFYWFISSENYLVIGGRDAQQNELIVKRYMRPTDIYVHAEIQGASSVVIRNPSGNEVPPKTLLEAGTMAISYSVAWDAKVVTNAYWVRSDQVSKTAPSGEYLGTGSFMIRGKKNFLPSCHLIMGLSLLFKLEDSFIEKHRGERKVRTFDEEVALTESQSPRHTENVKTEESSGSPARTATAVNASADTDTEDNSQYPDTQVKIEHDTGRVTVNLESPALTVKDMEKEIDLIVKETTDAAEDSTLISAVPIRQKQKQITNKKRKEDKAAAKGANKNNKQGQISVDKVDDDDWQTKRGQKSKHKRRQNKYKDQDDEERELRMLILKSSAKEEATNESAQAQTNEKETKAGEKPKKEYTKKPANVINDNADDNDDMPVGADVEMLDSLTGQPFDEDELLFAIPVVAPYQAMQNYKFKVKLTPGTGKRGAAAKTAINMFSKDKSCGQREKDLLKSIKEEAFARNIPGKVKLSAPQLQKYKK